MKLQDNFTQNMQLQILVALLAVYLFWGGSYLAMKVAIETIPPFLMGSLRFLAAGLVLYVWELTHGTPQPSRSEWGSASLVSGLLLVCSTGGLVWAEQFIPTSIAAIIFATVPFWMALIAWLFQGGECPKGLPLLGLGLGFCGVVILVKNSLATASSTSLAWPAYIIVTLAAIAWALGSLYSRTAKLPKSSAMSIGLQNIIAGSCYLVLSLLFGEWNTFSLDNVSLDSALSLLYLIFFGSLIAFAAYIWLLKAADSTLVSTYAYVNPVVAVLLGWTLAGEHLTSSDGVAAFIILCSVLMITKSQTNTQNQSIHPPLNATMKLTVEHQ